MVVRHRVGERAARLVAGIVALFLIVTGFGTLINPWNPSLLGLPFLLFVILGADAATGSTWSLIGAFVVGSYLVQTHVGMLPVAGVTLLVSTGAWTAGTFWRPQTAVRPPWRTLAAGGLVLGVLWAGPWRTSSPTIPGISEGCCRFSGIPRRARPRASVHDAVVAVSNEATRRCFGPPPVNRLSRRGSGLLAAAALLGALSAAVGWKRSRFTAVLGGSGAASLLVTVVATTRIVGDLEPYLFAWTPALLLPPLAAAGLVVLDRARPVGGPLLTTLPRLGVAALAVIGALLVRSTIRHRRSGTPTRRMPHPPPG